jgi:hypothetical protein
VGLRADLDTQARAEGLELWVAPPERRSWSSGGGVDCMGDIFILNEMWVQCKIYIF